ncbi:MAG: tetratricopeptide repeat protein [Saprospiraceae bacterium]
MKRFYSPKSVFILLLLVVLSCVSQKKKGEYKGLSKFYHNTSAKYNAYFNARELMNLSLSRIEAGFKEDYSKVLAVFPYEATEDVGGEKANLDKAIEKVATDISIHKYSRWADDCYFLLAKAQYVKKDYETAEASYDFLLNEYQPSRILQNSKSLKEKNAKSVKKERERKKEDAKKEAKKKAKAKAKARAKAKTSKGKKEPARSSAPVKEEETVPANSTVRTTTTTSKPLTNVGTRLMPHRPVFWEATIWSAKNLIKRGKFYEAMYRLDQMKEDPALASELRGELYATRANVYLIQDRYEEAIPELKEAIQFTSPRRQKARYAFILGQLYQMANRPVSSDEYFTLALRQHPSYDMTFHARMNLLINQSLQGESEEQLIQSLEKLAKDSKNSDYESEIYFSIGKIYFNKKKNNEAITYLNKAVWSPNANNNTKADAYYMLANMHFDQRMYQQSKYYFDSTLNFIGKSDKRRPVVNKMITNLKDIAEQIEIINLQDSLIRISKLSVKEKRNLAISIKNRKRIIPDLPDSKDMRGNAGENRVFRATDLIRSSTLGADRSNPDNKTPVAGAKSTFFAYDIKATNRGRSNFEQYWGERPLEDNWRRSKKTSFSTGIEDQQAETKDSTVKDELENDLAEILAGIPSSDEEIKEANHKIEEAMFQLGVAYRDRIDAYDRSRETLENLMTRYPETQRYADVLYYLYLDCLDLKDKVCADRNNELLKTRYADSYYTKLINDPEYAKSLMNKKDELQTGYEKAFGLYQQQQYEECHKILQALATKVKASDPLHPKIALLSAFCIGKTSGKEPYMAALKDVIANYPGSAQETKAKEILRFLRGDQDAFEVVQVTELESINFKSEDDQMHLMMVVFFNPAPQQIDKAKIKISDYHNKYHKLDNYKMTSLEINTEQNTSAIIIRKYDDKSQAMKYYNSIQKNREEYLPGLTNFEVYPITQNNYKEVLRLRSIREYQAFFKKNYEPK